MTENGLATKHRDLIRRAAALDLYDTLRSHPNLKSDRPTLQMISAYVDGARLDHATTSTIRQALLSDRPLRSLYNELVDRRSAAREDEQIAAATGESTQLTLNNGKLTWYDLGNCEGHMLQLELNEDPRDWHRQPVLHVVWNENIVRIVFSELEERVALRTLTSDDPVLQRLAEDANRSRPVASYYIVA